MSISGVSSNGVAYQASTDNLTQLTQQLNSLARSRKPCDPSITKNFLSQLESIGKLPDSQAQNSSDTKQSQAAASPPRSSTDTLDQLTQQLQSLSKSRHAIDPSVFQQFYAKLQSIGVLPEDIIING